MSGRNASEMRIFTAESITKIAVTLDINVNCGHAESSDRFSAANNLVKGALLWKAKNVS